MNPCLKKQCALYVTITPSSISELAFRYNTSLQRHMFEFSLFTTEKSYFLRLVQNANVGKRTNRKSLHAIAIPYTRL